MQDLFTNVLAKSNAIAGRFHIAPKGGIELNSDLLDEVLKDLVVKTGAKKYPLALMMPPRSMGDYSDRSAEWERLRIVIFFLKTSYYNNNQTAAIKKGTQTSTHTVPQDWHDMKRAAVNFIRVLNKIQRDRQLINSLFRMASEPRIIDPVSFVGVDRAAGVRLEFSVSLYTDCAIEDYEPTGIADIVIPPADSHPQHAL